MSSCCFSFFIVPNHEQALQQIVALKKEVSELRAKLASQEEDYHKSEGEMHAEVSFGGHAIHSLIKDRVTRLNTRG